VTGGWIKPMGATGVGDTRKALHPSPVGCEAAAMWPGAVVPKDYATGGR